LTCAALGWPLLQALGATSAAAAMVAAGVYEIVAETHFASFFPPSLIFTRFLAM
jgi:hypothetical protein